MNKANTNNNKLEMIIITVLALITTSLIAIPALVDR